MPKESAVPCRSGADSTGYGVTLHDIYYSTINIKILQGLFVKKREEKRCAERGAAGQKSTKYGERKIMQKFLIFFEKTIAI